MKLISVKNKVDFQFWPSLYDQVTPEVYDRVCAHVSDHVYDMTFSQARDQVWDEILIQSLMRSNNAIISSI